MAVKKSFYAIPPNTPYKGPGRLMLLCVPDDQIWITAVRESVRQLTKGRYWDRDTGVIVDAQETGKEIYDSMIICTDIIDKLQDIATAINNLQLTTSTQVTCCDQLTPPEPPTPLPDPLPPPGGDPADLPPAYGGDGPAYDAEVCRVANGVHWQIRKYLVWLSGLDLQAAIIALLVAGVLLLFPEPATTAIGVVTFTTIISVIVLYQASLDLIGNWADAAIVEWDNAQQDFVCEIYQALVDALDFKAAAEAKMLSILAAVAVSLPGMLTVAFLTGWMGLYLDWVENQIYNFSQDIESHPNPVSCGNCGDGNCFTFTYDAGYEGWVSVERFNNIVGPIDGTASLSSNPRVTYSNGSCRMSLNDLRTALGLSGEPVYVQKIEFDIYFDGSSGKSFEFNMKTAAGTYVNTVSEVSTTVLPISWTIPAPYNTNSVTNVIDAMSLLTKHNSTNDSYNIYIDNLKVCFETAPPA